MSQIPVPPTPSDHSCDPQDIGLKSIFLGPQAENSAWVKELVDNLFNRWFDWRRRCFPNDGRAISLTDQQSPDFVQRRERFAKTLDQLSSQFETEVPAFSPRYIGHMMSEISLPALLGHMIALMHNPNNISGEVSRVGTVIEREAISALLTMVGFKPEVGSGHFTSGGTVANFEALVRGRARLAQWLAMGTYARQQEHNQTSLFQCAHMGWTEFDRLGKSHLCGDAHRQDCQQYNFARQNPWQTGHLLSKVHNHPFLGPVVLVPENKHYSWQKGVSILGLGDEAFWPIALDRCGRLDLNSLKSQFERAVREQRPIVMVVSVAGTTEMGQVDPVAAVQEYLDVWKNRHGIHVWHHVDAAYGGFFSSLDRSQQSPLGMELSKNLAAMALATSITIDPHKLGYVPYSSGTILLREKRDYLVNPFAAPYIQYDTKDFGPFTLEGSRSAAGAVATWMTAKTVGLNPEGYGRVLERTILMRQKLTRDLIASGLPIQIAPHADTNVVCFTLALNQESLRSSNQRTESFYQRMAQDPKAPFFVSKTTLYDKSYRAYIQSYLEHWQAQRDQDHIVMIRLCLMNPFFSAKEMQTNFAGEFIRTIRDFLEQHSVQAK